MINHDSELSHDIYESLALTDDPNKKFPVTLYIRGGKIQELRYGTINSEKDGEICLHVELSKVMIEGKDYQKVFDSIEKSYPFIIANVKAKIRTIITDIFHFFQVSSNLNNPPQKEAA